MHSIGVLKRENIEGIYRGKYVFIRGLIYAFHKGCLGLLMGISGNSFTEVEEEVD